MPVPFGDVGLAEYVDMLIALAVRADVRLTIAAATGDAGRLDGVCSTEGLWIGRYTADRESSSCCTAKEGFLRRESRVRLVNDDLRDGARSGSRSVGCPLICANVCTGDLNVMAGFGLRARSSGVAGFWIQ